LVKELYLKRHDRYARKPLKLEDECWCEHVPKVEQQVVKVR
jgi:hypothetical protein